MRPHSVSGSIKSHEELVELALMCAQRARTTKGDRRFVEELWKLALDYQHRAGMSLGEKPDIGLPPALP